VAGDLVTFRWTFQFERDGTQPTSDSTLRFPGRIEIVSFLSAHGVDVVDIRDAPDRPVWSSCSSPAPAVLRRAAAGLMHAGCRPDQELLARTRTSAVNAGRGFCASFGAQLDKVRT
jgi:hypothetical protein